MMNLTLKDKGRMAVIAGNTLQCYRDSGKVKEHFISVWPPIEAMDARPLKRWAKKWIDEAKLPEVVQ